MHLKTLTLRGFKSFASATTLHFEPGVTCVVGPNGSGKSNVVDALAWVMGEQGAKSLRGGKMEDVIFAGTSARPPLGRAEVALTIDNSDGALPIEYTEVTISRTLFRSGGSEYAINGTPCRLLDIQELLSDTGMGREMHVIVGQGQLDTILRADPADRRGFIEEAAGVIKHRRRKEKAVRKLDATAGNIQRLVDLTGELRRQLGPLGRQAEVARKAATIQIDVRDARARLLADEIATERAAAGRDSADFDLLSARRAEVETELRAVRAQIAEAEEAAIKASPALAIASDVYYRLTATRDRLRSLEMVATERRRHLGSVPVHSGADPADLESQAERVRVSQAELRAEVEATAGHLTVAEAARAEAEEAARNAERELAGLHRAAADKRESLARLAGQLAAQKSRVEAGDAEIARLESRLTETTQRAAQATSQFTALEAEVAGAEAGEVDLGEAHDEAVAALENVRAALAEAEAAAIEAERERAGLAARLEALELSLVPADGTAALLSSDVASTLGSLAAHLSIEPGFEGAIAAALGPLADGLAVESVEAAVDAIRYLRDSESGRAAFVVAGAPGTSLGTVTQSAAAARDDTRRRQIDGAHWAMDLVQAGSLQSTVDTLLAGVVVVSDLAQAREVLAAYPDLTTVTRAGDVLSATIGRGGSAAAPSTLHLQAAVDEAQRLLADATATRERLAFDIARLTNELADAQTVYDATLDKLHESDAAITAVAEQLGHLGAVARAAAAEAERIEQAIEAARQARHADAEVIDSLEAQVELASAEPEDAAQLIVAATATRDETGAAAAAARATETDLRLKLRTAEERERALAARAESLERAAAAERAAIAKAEEAAAKRAVAAAEAESVADGARRALAAIEPAIAQAASRRDAEQAANAERVAALAAARVRHDDLAGQAASLADAAHAEELARAEHRLRLEALAERALTDLGIDADDLVAEFGPDVPITVIGEDGEQTEIPFVRAEQEKRLRKAERDLAVLGKVNPLALEEFAALEERHTYLSTQLTDLRKTREDLLDLIGEIDERVQQVFAEAFADTAVQFERVFEQLFPGGEGRLVLTEPDNMLETGIEVEARPAGKKVKRLSLLSGGERSLTALALLIAIFKARPSPFYVLDEVEAALDDINLTRLLRIFASLQEDSQLIVVTHQKSTMEIADALYGVTMRSGVSTVISQRMSDTS